MAASLSALKQFVLDSLPLAAVAHSYHLDALAQPALRANPTFERFNLTELNELHHQVGMLGALLRLEEGDPTALGSLGRDLAGFLGNRVEALRLAQSLPPAIWQHPALQSVLALTQESNRQLAQHWPVLAQTLALTGAPVPAGFSAAAAASIRV